jgi:hypothetical protein
MVAESVFDCQRVWVSETGKKGAQSACLWEWHTSDLTDSRSHRGDTAWFMSDVITVLTSGLYWYDVTAADFHDYRGADKSLARPSSWYILFDGENISFHASLVV